MIGWCMRVVDVEGVKIGRDGRGQRRAKSAIE